MLRISNYGLLSLLALCLASSCTSSDKIAYKVDWLSDNTAIISIDKPTKYILLPIEEKANETKVCLLDEETGEVDMDIRLARNKVDYCVPFELPQDKNVTLRISNIDKECVTWKEIALSDTFNTDNVEPFRPVYHFTPSFGWMNDPNGMVYKDGVYHLFYQYNPYGSMWGNMHWGHTVSRDLVNWEQQPVALERDTMGHIFSGSSVVDKNNTAGFGEGAIVAFYTSASDKNGQIQCLAYSTDNGRSFTKYQNNPILTPFDGLRDFRDPKVFWYEPQKKWVMIVSADKEMRFYSSSDLKDWTYMSSFGEGYGIQPNQFECPDFFELPVDGNPDKKKWVMIVNVNPGCMFGGSATEYFVGDFDGTKFTCDTPKEVTKWMDWGKDHYATVTFSNTGDRVIAMPWMSNWQYANIVPTKQFRSAQGLPRELSLYSEDGHIYMASTPVDELSTLRNGTSNKLEPFKVDGKHDAGELIDGNKGTYELNVSINPLNAKKAGFTLKNSKGENVKIYLDLADKKLVMDRVNSSLVDFGEKSAPHAKENHNNRKTNAINYVNDFALATWGKLPTDKKFDFRIFVDKCSVEIFLNGGKVAMTNLVFPTEPYTQWEFFGEGGTFEVEAAEVYGI